MVKKPYYPRHWVVNTLLFPNILPSTINTVEPTWLQTKYKCLDAPKKFDSYAQIKFFDPPTASASFSATSLQMLKQTLLFYPSVSIVDKKKKKKPITN